jgi:hypothetical protein
MDRADPLGISTCRNEFITRFIQGFLWKLPKLVFDESIVEEVLESIERYMYKVQPG